MPAVEPRIDTPLMRQYQAIKASHPHAVVFFRLGDFYEMFADDAKEASPILGLVLTARQGVPMCGVPAHSAAGYVAKLLRAGRRVAIADQTEDPAKAKGLVERKVTRLITPGTVVEDELLDASHSNYLAAVELDGRGWGLACAEVSTGEFWAAEDKDDPDRRRLSSVLARLDPAEVILPRREAPGLDAFLPRRAAVAHYDRPPAGAPEDASWASSPQWTSRPLAAAAASAALGYIAETQSRVHGRLTPVLREIGGEMQLDEAAVRTLELTASSDGGRKHSLWGVLDKCHTPMGSRRLKNWILHPLTDAAAIARRQDGVEDLLKRPQARKALGQILREIADLERVASRLATRSAAPRDLAAVRDSLLQLGSLRGWLAECAPGSALAAFKPDVDALEAPLERTRALLETSIAERPSARVSDGGVIRPGFDPRLDDLRSLRADSRKYLAEIEARERRETGIPSLKVGYTSVFGYYLEATRPHLPKIPGRYVRKQTLANAERFITPELKELEAKLLGAEEAILRLEAELFESVRGRVLQSHASLLRLACAAADLDVLGSLAEAAHLNGWARPAVEDSLDLRVEEGRHPVVEAALPAGSFAPNSLSMDGSDPQMIILTGPNMGGKSTYLRQNALIVLMAQMGSFVPAKSATIGIADKILTRIGSQDALSRNESTFMVEMRETAHILQAATPRSLVILDEVGRGTSTFDGISIAWAVLERLNAAFRPPGERGSSGGPRVLFATHYFELTRLAESLKGVRNASVEAREWTNAEGRTEVVFLHKISPGPADRSFGIHVARLAGLPEPCLERARELLKGLEAASPLSRGAAAPRAPALESHPVLSELERLRPDEMTPLEALERIARWKKSL